MANSPFVAIDVGGKAFKLMRNTIMKFPKSTLARVITGQDTESALIDSGTYYFDRNPDYFTVLTDFMRTGKVFLSPNISAEMFALEANFWGLSEAISPPQQPTAPKPSESTVVLGIGPTLVLDPDFKPPAAPNGYQVSFGVSDRHHSQAAGIKPASSEGSLASSASIVAAADPLLGNFIGGLELKKSIETGSLKRKGDEVAVAPPPPPPKRAKLKPRTIPSDEELQAAYQKLVTLEEEKKPVATVKPPTVIMSGFDLNERNTLAEKIKSLRGRVTETFEDSPSHLVLTEFKNTKKLLIALTKGLEVVSSRWVYESVKAGAWLPADQFYACTAADEQKHNFRYKETLEKARRGGFLRDAVFYVSPSVKPSSRDFEELVQAAGGRCLPKRPITPAAGLYAILDPKCKEAEEMTAAGFLIHSSEWLCECVFQQKLS